MKIPSRFDYLDMNEAFSKAIESVFYDKKNTLIMGNAGSGKSEFLKLSRAICEENRINAVFLAPTGIAAINVEGQTLHSFFKLPLSWVEPEYVGLKQEVADLINETDILFIDEISMVQALHIEIIDSLCRRATEVYHKPFGGKQIVMVGDLYQLPPVISRDTQELALYQAKYGDNPYFFGSSLFTLFGDEFTKIQFSKIYRQKESDFVDILNRIRIGKQTEGDLAIINSRVIPYEESDKEAIYVSPFNKTVDRINHEQLTKIASEALLIPAQVTGYVNFKNHLVPKDLILKENCKVMTLVNNFDKGYQNGSIGTFIKVIDMNTLLIDIDGRKITIERYEFKEYVYEVVDGALKKKQKGCIKQFPLKLSYALTAHKSQGQTFKKSYIDLGRIFNDHMVYLMLSRAVSLDSLGLKRKLTHKDIMISEHVNKFMETFEYSK